MNQAKLYSRCNQTQRSDASRVVTEFASIIQWRSDGQDRLLDVGCGSSDVLYDYILPMLPKNFKEIVGLDISKPMIEFSIKEYGVRDERLKFVELDAAAEELPQDLLQRFDHVTSLYCLHWVQNQRQAIKNVYKFLSSPGDCLLVFLGKTGTFEVYKIMSRTDRWAPYMQDYRNYISPQHDSANPREELEAYMREAGFTEFKVDVRDELHYYTGYAMMRENIRAICPFLERIPKEEHEEFLDEFFRHVAEMGNSEVQPDGDLKFKAEYNLIVVYARKHATDTENGASNGSENVTSQ